MKKNLCLALLLALSLGTLSATEIREYRVYIVSDTLRGKFVELADGLRATLDRRLATVGRRAVYTTFDTKGELATVPAILQAIQTGQPDLICTINNSGVFADTHITKRLTDPRYRFVSENCIPVQSGVAKDWNLPGGNVTGVGVFPSFTPLIRLAKMIRPQSKKVYFWSWGAMKPINEWFRDEISRACQTEGVELAEFTLVDSAEDQFAYMQGLDQRIGPDAIAIEGLSAWVHRDGTPADMVAEENRFIHGSTQNLFTYGWDETGVRYSQPAGITVIWYDLGAQLGEKAFQVLSGADPGALAWENPRSHNIVVNLAGAKRLGMKLPEALVSAAYRVYTDFDGHYVGQKN